MIPTLPQIDAGPLVEPLRARLGDAVRALAAAAPGAGAQRDAPAPEVVPAGHGRHVELDAAPTDTDHVPLGQARHGNADCRTADAFR